MGALSKKGTKGTEINPPPLAPLHAVSKKHILAAAIIASIVAFLSYANTIGHGYTVDDDTVMAKNSITKGGIDSLGSVFGKPYRAGFWDRQENMYRPLSVAMFAIEWELFPENPMPGHLVNVVFFSLTCFLLMLLLSRMLTGFPLVVPLAATLLFAVHPIHTEVVANIKSRDEILCLLFCLVSLLQLDEYFKKGRLFSIGMACAAYFLALLSKEHAITLLAVFPLWGYFFGKGKRKPILKATVVMGIAAVSFLLIRMAVLGSLETEVEIQRINNVLVEAEGYGQRFATAVAILGRYLVLLVFPHPLSFDYSFDQIPLSSFASPGFLLTFALFATAAYHVFKSFGKRDPLHFGILFFVITFSVVSNVVILIESTMAERFMYMPSVGFVVFASVGLARLTKTTSNHTATSFIGHFKNHILFISILGIVCLTFAFKTISRNADWKDNFTLLSKDVKTCPKSARIRFAFGSALLFEKAYKTEDLVAKNAYLDQSISNLEKGVNILPEYAEAWKNLAIAYKEKENYPSAVAAFEKARSFKAFEAADIFAASGMCYGKTGRYNEALTDLRQAISMNPSDAESFNNIGLYLFESGQVDSSLIYFDKAISLKKDFHQAYYNKGNTFARKGDFNGAIQLYGFALGIKPNNIDALMNTGNSYAAMQQYGKALEFFKKVETLDPSNRNLIMNLGLTYQNLGDKANAELYLSKAVPSK